MLLSPALWLPLSRVQGSGDLAFLSQLVLILSHSLSIFYESVLVQCTVGQVERAIRNLPILENEAVEANEQAKIASPIVSCSTDFFLIRT